MRVTIVRKAFKRSDLKRLQLDAVIAFSGHVQSSVPAKIVELPVEQSSKWLDNENSKETQSRLHSGLKLKISFSKSLRCIPVIPHARKNQDFAHRGCTPKAAA